MPTGIFYAIYQVHKTTFQWSRGTKYPISFTNAWIVVANDQYGYESRALSVSYYGIDFIENDLKIKRGYIRKSLSSGNLEYNIQSSDEWGFYPTYIIYIGI